MDFVMMNPVNVTVMKELVLEEEIKKDSIVKKNSIQVKSEHYN